MKRILLLFGAKGALGSEAANVFLDKITISIISLISNFPRNHTRIHW